MPKENKNFENPEPTVEQKKFVEELVDALAKNDMERYKELISIIGKEIKHPKDDEIREVVQVQERLKKVKKRRKKMIEGEFTEDGSFPTRVFRDSDRARFYRLLEENFPALGVKVKDAKDNSLVKVMLEGGDAQRVKKLGSDSVVSTITEEMGSNAYSHRRAKRLEEEEKLPEGTADRLLARHYKKGMAGFKEGGQIAQVFEDRLKELGAEPLSDAEMDKIIMQAVERFLEEEGAASE